VMLVLSLQEYDMGIWFYRGSCMQVRVEI
jgi:hypothetical protein